MSNSTAWGRMTVSPDARGATERAVARAGVALEESLNRAIVAQASEQGLQPSPSAGAQGRPVKKPSDGSQADETSMAQDDRISPPREGASARELQKRLRATAGLVGQGATRVEEAAFRPARWIVAPFDGSAAVNSPRVTESTKGADGAAQNSADKSAMDVQPAIASAAGRHLTPPPKTTAFGGPAAPFGAMDFRSAISQIVSRRRALDARQAISGLKPAAHDDEDPSFAAGTSPQSLSAAAPGCDSVSDPTPAPASSDGQRQENRGTNTGIDGSTAPFETLGSGLQTLSKTMDALRRERSDAKELEVLQGQKSAIRRVLSELGSRDTIGESRTSAGDPTKPGSAGAQEARDLLLAPVDIIFDQLAKSLDAQHPKPAAADIGKRIDSLGAKVDALADAGASPQVIEGIGRRIGEVHDLLVAAARRSFPFERLEGQIKTLADQVERLVANAPATHQSGRIDDRPAAVGPTGQVLAPSALERIEQALESISNRLAGEEAALSQIAALARTFEGAAHRIESTAQMAASNLETSLEGFDSNLKEVVGESIAPLIHELNAELERDRNRNDDRLRINSTLSEIDKKLTCLLTSDPEGQVRALGSIDDQLKSMRAGIEETSAALLDRQVLKRFAADIAQDLEAQLGSQMTAAIADRVAPFVAQLDALATKLGAAAALESAARDVVDKLQIAASREAAHPTAGLAQEMAAFREERVRAERRTEDLLQCMQDVLDRLVGRMSSVAPEPPARGGDREDNEPISDLPAIDPARISGLDGPALQSGPSRRGSTGARPNTWHADADEELLLEPGAGAPHSLPAGEMEQVSRTHPSVSAHIAAARRAAQSAALETDAKKARGSFEGTVRRAQQVYARHRRVLVLAGALVLAVAAAAGLMSGRAPFMQKSERTEASINLAATQAGLPRQASPVGAAPSSLDRSPTGSIERSPAAEGRTAGPAQAELSARIPGGVESSLREAALSGSPAAEYDLAQRLFEGRDAPQDQKAAAFWFERAASAGLAPAQFRLGAMYQKGIGVAQDSATARRWYTAAAQLGNARAAHNLGVMEAQPAGGSADYAEAVKWFRRAAEIGVRDSQFNLGVLYARGLGVEQDLRQAWMWFSLAATRGDAEAARKRDEVAGKMDPGALAEAADQLSKFRAAPPDPVANEVSPLAPVEGAPQPPSTAIGRSMPDREPRKEP